MDSCVWRATIHSLFSGDSAQQTVAPSSDFFEDKWLKTGTLKRWVSRTEIRNTGLAAMETTVDQQDDNHEVQRLTDWPVQVRNKIDFVKKKKPSEQQCDSEEEKIF
ncbi:hypothetical protein AVEN_40605-1 [Araneus ventricosus]|uniref:Uncharacterized protein n=1 Tax=Araneus ventricosus TaxID=182803 RepID=A0A4Y2J9R7_ARAVE|nr:hypothetical protein AVEN_40605-1 [Araneus ventricosus]